MAERTGQVPKVVFLTDGKPRKTRIESGSSGAPKDFEFGLAVKVVARYGAPE